MRAGPLVVGLVTAGVMLGAASLVQKRLALSFTGLGQAQGAAMDDTFDEVLTQQVPNLLSASISSDATYIATVSGQKSYLSLRDATHDGKTVWTRIVPGARAAVVTRNGSSVLAYSPFDSVHTSLTVFHGSDGSVARTEELDGPVWSVAVSTDGAFAAVVTGGQSLYVFSLQPHHPGVRRWALPGIGQSVAFSKDNGAILVGTWDSSGVLCYTRSGSLLWRFPNADAQKNLAVSKIFETYPAQERHAFLAMSYNNARHTDGSLYYWRMDDSGRPSWSYAIGENTSSPKAALSGDGHYVALTYTHTFVNNDRAVAEHWVTLLDNNSEPIWKKGGLLFSPTLVAVAPDGHRVTVSDGRKTLYHLNAYGRISASWPTAQNVARSGLLRETLPTPDGRYLLAYTGDGTLHLLKLQRPG